MTIIDLTENQIISILEGTTSLSHILEELHEGTHYNPQEYAFKATSQQIVSALYLVDQKLADLRRLFQFLKDIIVENKNTAGEPTYGYSYAPVVHYTPPVCTITNYTISEADGDETNDKDTKKDNISENDGQ